MSDISDYLNTYVATEYIQNDTEYVEGLSLFEIGDELLSPNDKCYYRGIEVYDQLLADGSRVYEETHPLYYAQADLAGVIEEEHIGENSNSSWGTGIGFSGNYVYVGANQADVVASNEGVVYIYLDTDGTWDYQGYIESPDGNSGDAFGSVEINESGSLMAVGAPYSDDNGTSSGNVQMYSVSGGVYAFMYKVYPSSTSSRRYIGEHTAIYGSTLYLGNQLSGGGEVDVIALGDEGYTITNTITEPTVTSGNNFGIAVAVNAEMLLICSSTNTYRYDLDGTLVGALGITARYLYVDGDTLYTEDNDGYVYIYTLDGTSVELVGTIDTYESNTRIDCIKVHDGYVYVTYPGYSSTTGAIVKYTVARVLPTLDSGSDDLPYRVIADLTEDT